MNIQSSLRKISKKIKKIIHSRRWIYFFSILIFSLAFIIVISCYSSPGWLWLVQTISSSLFSAVIFFFLFNIIYDELRKSDEERGELLTHIELTEFIKTIQESKSKTQIYIMETWTDLLISENYSENFTKAIRESIRKHNTKFNILLLNPENTELVKNRADELEGKHDVEINIYRALCKLEYIRQNLKQDKKQAQLEVKLYNIKPILAIYSNQDDLSITFFQRKLSSTKGKTLRFPMGSASSEFIIDQFFDIIWDETITQTTRDIESVLYLDVKVTQIDSPSEEPYEKKVKYVYNSEQYNDEHKNIKIFLLDVDVGVHIHSLTEEGKEFTLSINDEIFNHRTFTLDRLSSRVRELFISKYPILERENYSVIGLFS